MEQLKQIKNCLMTQIMSQMGNLQDVDTKELGEAIDMLLDIEKSMYYCSITKAMEEKEPEVGYYTDRRDMDYPRGRMYYAGNGVAGGNSSSMGNQAGSRNYTDPWQYPGNYYYTERPMNFSIRDEREGRSPMQRRMYMEAHGQEQKMEELEKYMKELSNDIMDMIKDASPDERRMLQQKISTLASKI